MDKIIGKTPINEINGDLNKVRMTILRLCLNGCIDFDKADKLIEAGMIMDLDVAMTLLYVTAINIEDLKKLIDK